MATKKLKTIITDDKDFLFQNYGNRLPVSFARGEGSFLYDQDNKEYIDFLSGIAVNNFGYGNKALTAALQKQINSIVHSSNWFLNKEQIEAARLISEISFPGKSLFVNSGTEAIEAAIKLVRKYGLDHSKKRLNIISFNGSFHGRTYGSMSATGQKKIQTGFGPMVPGFITLPFNDITRVKQEIKKNKNITAVCLELIQGEGGIIAADKAFVKELFSLCQKNNILTVVDEIQTGIGRTGKFFAYQHYGISPDIITLAKGLGGGMPVGAIHAKNYLANYLDTGSHGTTFGGNHLASVAAVAVIKELKKNSTLNHVDKISSYIFNELNNLKEELHCVSEIRGMGLHIGIKIDRPGFPIVQEALTRGLIINCTAENIIRIMPPLNIPLPVVKKGIKILKQILLEEGEKK